MEGGGLYISLVHERGRERERRRIFGCWVLEWMFVFASGENRRSHVCMYAYV